MKNLIISTESIRGILRLSPQNDITTQSPRGEGEGGGDVVLFIASVLDCQTPLSVIRKIIDNFHSYDNLYT